MVGVREGGGSGIRNMSVGLSGGGDRTFKVDRPVKTKKKSGAELRKHRVQE